MEEMVLGCVFPCLTERGCLCCEGRVGDEDAFLFWNQWSSSIHNWRVSYGSIRGARSIQHHTSGGRLLRIFQLDRLTPSSTLFELLSDIKQWFTLKTRPENLARLVGILLRC